MHYHVEANVLICLIKWLYKTYSGGFSLLESSLLNIDISLTTHSYFTNIYPEPVVATHHQLINQEASYTAPCVAVDLKFNS